MRIAHALQGTGQSGFSYVEVLLSALLVTVLLVPALQALQTGIAGGNGDSAASRQLRLRAKMEEALARPFAKLYAETYLAGGNTTNSVSATYSDAVGQADRRVVVLYRYNASTNALSSGDTGLVFVSVYYEADGSAGALATLTGRWW